MTETPRQRQVRLFEQGSAAARAQSARQRRNEAKCSLVGHRWREVTDTSSECERCGAMHHDQEGHA